MTDFNLANAIADANAEQLERLGIAMRWPGPQVPPMLLKRNQQPDWLVCVPDLTEPRHE